MKLSVNRIYSLGEGKFIGSILLIAGFIFIAGFLFWAADFWEDISREEGYVYVGSLNPIPTISPLPAIPTEREMNIAIDLMKFYPQESPKRAVEVFREIVRALVKSRGREVEEEAPGLLRHSSRSSGSYID